MKRTISFLFLLSLLVGLVGLSVSMPKRHPRVGWYFDDPATKTQRKRDDNQTIPEAWRGTWEVTVTYRDHETGALVATNVTTAEVCPGEPIVPALPDLPFSCSKVATPGQIGILCSASFTPQKACHIAAEAWLYSQRVNDSWSGNGSWCVHVEGNCNRGERPSSASVGKNLRLSQDFSITGRRLSANAACDDEPSSIVQSFFAYPDLVPFLAMGVSHEK